MVNNKLPPVSIGIPFFNADRFLLDAIKSVFAQTHQDWELILMDDGSSDRSLEIARSIDDPRVRVYSDGQNKKLAARLNEIHSFAKYDFVARMDADDLMATDRIEKQLALIVETPEYDLVTTGVCSITDDSSPYGMRVPSDDHALTPYKVLSGAHGIVHAAVVGRRDWFLRNPYDPADHWAEDYKLWVRASRKDDLSIGFICEPLYFYREEGSATPQKMFAGQRVGREVIRANALQMVGAPRAAYLFGRSLLKSAVVGCVAAVGETAYLTRARSPVTDRCALQAIRADISRITKVHMDVRRPSSDMTVDDISLSEEPK